MKRAVSISLGSSTRNKLAEITLLNETIGLERRGTDGDMEQAAQLYRDLDGTVDAFGVGGADLGLTVDEHWYPLHSVAPMVRFVKHTPIVDGSGLKNTLERHTAPFLEAQLAQQLPPKRVLITVGADRWGMSQSFLENGYDCVFGDLMFGLGLPIPLRSAAMLKRVAALVMPVAGRLPFHWVYPTGAQQESTAPKYPEWFQWASIIAGDCHYIKRHMPTNLAGKIICTNTTTEADVERFRAAGVTQLITTTPVIAGRSFGTNLMEAALIAASGQRRRLTADELNALIQHIGLTPTLQTLN